MASRHVLRINHVGVAVPSIARFLETQDVLYGGLDAGSIIENERQRVNEVFLSDGRTVVELLEPRAASSPLDSFLQRNRGGGPIHLALDVVDLDAALTAVRAAGGRVIVEPTPDVAFASRRIAFVYLGGIVTELIETAS